MIPQIKELNFPEYATLSQATVTLHDMGERTISAQIKIDGEIKPDFSYDWEVEFMGEKFIHALRSPQALKDNSSICSKIDLTFQHWAIYQMKRFYFVELASTNSGTAIADKYIASLGLNLGDFIVAFRNVLDYYFKGAITIDLNPEWQVSSTPAYMNISYSYIWDVLQQIYEVYGVRWSIEGNTIKVGYPTSEISHVFEYGYDKGLLSVERQVQDTNIRNSLLGRGGSTNLPQYYFKNAPEGSLYASDPDAIPELANIYFSELRGKTFRDYVKGWKAAHYGAEPIENPTAAYIKGYTDTDFNPIETIEDSDSIKKYGLLQGGLENNEDIYPSIQDITLDGIGLVNEVVAVEPVLSDDVDSATNQKAIISDIDNLSISKGLHPNETTTLRVEFAFSIKEGYKGSLFFDTKTSSYGFTMGGMWGIMESVKFGKIKYSIANQDGVLDAPLYNMPSGDYVIQIQCDVNNPENYSFMGGFAEATLEVSNIKLSQSRFNEGDEEWKPTFDIWVKNIWQTSKLANETAQEYADRVWLPILGDEGREAMVVFSSGWLSSSSDWDFMIVKGGYAYDTSKSHNGVPSHWRLTLQKSDAEIKATDKYIPNVGMQAVAGDTFFFTGIDMQHQYVLFAEQRIDEWKADNLLLTKDITPTWVAKFDKIRINTLETNDADLLVKQIKIGSSLRLADKRFIDSSYIEVYVQSITYNYSSNIIPDIEVVLSNEVATVKNPVEQIQSDINVLSRQIGSISNIQQLVRQIGDKLYLRKDGIEDYSNSPTQFNSIVNGKDFRQGAIGGSGWGIYKDGNGNTIGEFDKIIARKEFVVNNLIINQASYIGGIQINSAAAIECTAVQDLPNGYKCYFDQKQGSVVNLFKVNDVAYCQSFFLENNTLKYYKRKVIGVGDNYILLSKSESDGNGIPSAGDNIIHFGNYSDRERQYVIIRDVVGGGYERMLSDLNSVTATGTEYYFAGRINNGTPRWFVGYKDGEYAEWVDGKLKIKGTLEVGSDVGGATVVDGGLVTAETISLGSEGSIKAGTTGKGTYDEDIRFWAGSTFEDRANAPFRVNQKGQVVMTDANVSGTVNATNGVFKGSLAFKYQELPQGDEVLLSFESGFNFAGVEAWNGTENPYKTLILPSFGTSYNGFKCTIINNGFGFSVNGESAYPYKYFKVKTQDNFAFLHNSMNRYADSDITEVWIEAGRLVTFTATILNGVVRWVIENEDGLKPIQANANVLRGNGMPQPYVFWVGEIDTQKDSAGFYQTPYSFMGYSDDIDVKMDSITSKFNVTFRTEMSDDWIYVPQITSMGATTFSIEDKSNSGFSIRMNGKIQLTILMLRSTIIL